MLEHLGWYWNRLRRMSPGEAFFRVRQLALTCLQQYGFRTAGNVPPLDISPVVEPWFTVPDGLDSSSWLAAADRILCGEMRVFSLDRAAVGHPPQWNRDIRTGTVAPMTFGKRLNYRDENLVGDIKYLWEPNRHLHIVTLAQAWALSHDPKYLTGIGDQIDAWLDQCPYLLGANWTSSLELGIRLINWSLVWQLVGGSESALFAGQSGQLRLQRWVKSVYQHAHFIEQYFSRYSSANNHLFGEAAGLYVAATVWPYWKSVSRWRRRSRAILVAEMLSQNGPDGVNREQAVSYQQFMLDFALSALLSSQAAGDEFPQEYLDRMELMMDYLASIMDVNGNVPMIGDADDGYVFALSHEDNFCPYRSLLATGAVLFDRPDFKHKSGGLDGKTRWLLGDGGVDHYNGITSRRPDGPARRDFRDGGYYVMGADFETAKEVRLVVDAGPLGYLSIAAHGHADALSFCLSIGGQEILIDPGTYAYHTDKTWRDYFRGTSAHNTVRLDRQDQSVSGGNFMWTRHAVATCDVFETGTDIERFAGYHDGYQRLNDPVLVRRAIVLNKETPLIAVTDSIDCRQAHLVEQFWHFAEDCEVSCKGARIKVKKQGVTVILTNRSQDQPLVTGVRGQAEPPLGWVSRSFDRKIPATTVVWAFQISGEETFVTDIEWRIE